MEEMRGAQEGVGEENLARREKAVQRGYFSEKEISGEKEFPTEEDFREALELRHTKPVQEKISAARVAICGLGGLGSNIAIALARCGIGGLHLIDFDRVDLSNLNRQQYGIAQLGRPKPEALAEVLRAVNPWLPIRTDFVRLTEENVLTYLQEETYICEAFDAPEAKAMLTNAVLTHCPEKYLVGASGMAGVGESNRIQTRRVLPHYYLCGDGVSGTETCGSLVAPRVMLCAAHQANKILEIIVKGE
ncbi:MAG: sulfur carrier protein ThiS adenylyltransferase ThiF [Lachnospiraceae bacterium]|nr:sulfur carrier protein ThiS adenylyltransferase ThiF [Lachnospiraceae bacterium]